MKTSEEHGMLNLDDPSPEQPETSKEAQASDESYFSYIFDDDDDEEDVESKNGSN